MKSSNGVYRVKQQKSERSFQDYIGIIARGKVIAAVTFIACMLGAILYYYVAERVYQATATVLIDQKQPSFPVTVEGSNRQVLQNIKNELEILKSRPIADTVAAHLLEKRTLDSLGLVPIPIIQQDPGNGTTGIFASKNEIIGRLSEVVDFDPLRETDIIKITVKDKNAEQAALIANQYAQAYFERNIYMSRSRSRALREFLAAQVRDKRDVLDITENNLQQYMEGQGIVSLDDESKKIIAQLAELEATRDAADIQLKSLSTTLASYKEQFPQQEADVARLIGQADDQYIRGLQTQIAELEVQRDVTIAQNPSYAGKELYNDRLREIDDQINGLRIKLQKRTNEFIQTVPASKMSNNSNDPTSYLKQLKQNILETGIEMQSIQARKSALDVVIRQYNSEFDKIPRKSIQFAKLQRSKMSSEKLFLLVEAKYNEAAISERSEFGYISVMDPAVVPNSPASPRLLVNLLIGGLLGLALGLGAVFVREVLDVRLQSPEDLKKRGYTLLAAIMNMDSEIRNANKEDAVASFQGDLDPHLITLFVPFSPIAESYRLLRTTLQFSRTSGGPHVILVTSPNPSEGKTTTACNLAISFAQTGKRVLLVDCDLRKPNVHKTFKLEMKPGLAELLFKVGAHELAIQSREGLKDLDIMCSGALSPNPAEILGSKEMRTFVDQARREYDVVLLDASPILAATDASVLATLVDGVVLVAAAGSTRVNDVERSVELLESVGGKVIGVVLNMLDLHRAYGITYGKRGYHYYSYSYSHTKSNGNASHKTSSRK